MLTLFKGEELPINYPTEKIILSAIELSKKGSYDYTLFNFSTLVRNFITALDFEDTSIANKSQEKFKILKGGEFLTKYMKAFKQDIELINTILNDNKIKPIYYSKDYSKLKKCFPNIMSEEDMPPARALTEKYTKSFKHIADDNTIEIIDNFRNVLGEDYLLVTHNTLDLLQYSSKRNVKLLESFTGEVKPVKKWYTKYRKMSSKDMSILPFNAYLLAIFGCNNYVKPSKIKLRRNIYELGIKRLWNNSSTEFKIKNDLENYSREAYNNAEDFYKCYKKN